MSSSTLSYSSSLLINACEQKYAYYKVHGVERDYPFETSRALVLGKTVHEVAEDLEHVPVSDDILQHKVSAKLNEYVVENPESLSYFPLAYAMTKSYLDFHAKSGLKVVACEFKIKTERVLSYLDIILKDKDENFYISDLKTKSRFNLEKDGPLLKRDIQLHLYGSFHQEIKNHFELKGNFKGYLYRVVKTPLLRQKKGETKVDFYLRLQKSVEVVQVHVPHEQSAIDEAMSFFNAAYDKKTELENGVVPVKNFSECINMYGSVCAWFSQCYGEKHEDVRISAITNKDLATDI